jgi:hypothetical protein
MVGADGSIKSVMRSGEKVIDASTLGARERKRMVVIGGHHAGLECIVRKLDVNGRQGVFKSKEHGTHDCSGDFVVHCMKLGNVLVQCEQGFRATAAIRHGE